MLRHTETNPQVNAIHHSPPTQGRARSRRRSPWRLARSAVMVLGAGVLIGAVALTFFPKQQTAQAILCNCNLHSPEPGPGRSWEVDIPVSTYSRVNTRHGNVFTAIPIVSWSGRGPDMNMMLYHNSANVAATNTFAAATGFSLGPGWSISYSDHLLLSGLPNTVTVVADDGTKDVFTWNDTIWQPPFGVHDQLTQDTQNSAIWRVKHKNQSYHEFEQTSPGATVARLKRVVDVTENAITLTYVGGILTQIWDDAERRLNLSTYEGYLGQITDPRDEECGGDYQPECTIQTRWWSLVYDTNGRLEHIRDAMGYENAFTYDASGRLAWISDKYKPVALPAVPDIDWYGYAYESGGRLNWVLDPVGGLTQGFTYCCAEWQNSVGYPIRELRTYYTDRRNKLWLYKYGDDPYTVVPTAYLKDISSPLNGYRYFGFDEDRNLLYFCEWTGAVFNCWDSTYDSNGNRLTLTDPLGHSQTWTYGAVNNVTSSTDAAGNIVRYYYDNPAYPTLFTRIVEPSSSGNPPLLNPGAEFPVTQLAYYLGTSTLDTNGFGQIESITDPNGVWTGFKYDKWGQPATYSEGRVSPTSNPVYNSTTTADSGGRVVRTSYYAGGGQTASSGEGGCGSAGYDAANNATSSSCPTCIGVAQAAASAVPQGFPPLPCDAASLPEVWATFSGALYSPKGELTELALDLTIDPPGLNNTQYYTRTHTATFDGLGRQTDGVVTSNEYGAEIPRPFTYDHDWAAGTYTRTGPDGVETFVQLDEANRVQFVRRGPAAAPLMTASYTYFGNDLVQSVTYGNGASTWYTYDAARRVTRIEHRASGGSVLLALDYFYTDNDLPVKIYETGSTVGVGITITTTFAYDRLRRLTQEQRCRGIFACTLLYYGLEYWYDAGGNRIKKIDASNARETVYHYDLENATVYGSYNNRLKFYKTFDTNQSPTNPSDPGALLSTTWYYYTAAGNVDRVVTREDTPGEPGPMAASVGGELGTMDAASQTTTVEGAVAGGEAAAALLVGGGSDCPTGYEKYTATRFGYAKNGQAVTFVHDESWCWNGVDACEVGGSYQIGYAREFRYDGARARYMNAPLNPATLRPYNTTEKPTVWSDYDGDEVHGDFTITGTTVTNTDAYEPGLWRKIGSTADYLHNDHLGTLRQTSNTSGGAGASRVFTAFGERLPGSATDRFGYVGAWGYQDTLDSTGAEVFPFLHVGARYYDPSSGRFLQRDPIGIDGGLNVYAYVDNTPTDFYDPDGFAKRYRDPKTGRFAKRPWWSRAGRWTIGKIPIWWFGKQGAKILSGSDYEDPEDIIFDILDDYMDYERSNLRDWWKRFRNPPPFPPSWRGRQNYRGGALTC